MADEIRLPPVTSNSESDETDGNYDSVLEDSNIIWL